MRVLKRNILLTFTLIISSILPQIASAYDFIVDDIAYNINSNDTSVTVTINGNYTGAINIPSSVNYNGKNYSVTSIGWQAFAECTRLTSVTIPNSVTSIGNYAFKNCTGLTSVTIPNSVTSIGQGAFYDCTGLTKVTIGNSVTSIGNYAFKNCTGLTSVTIPNSVTSIRDGAFYGCSGLTSVNISDIAAWCNISFGNYIDLGHNLYLNGNKVTDLVIPNSVTKIKKYAFKYCTGLTSVTIPNSVTSIGECAFYGCYHLT